MGSDGACCPGRRKWAPWAFLAGVLAIVAAGVALNRAPEPHPAPAPSAVVQERFESGDLEPATWAETAEGDFQEKSVQPAGGRLRLRCATRGTRSDTVKFLGARSGRRVSLADGARVAADLDWNNQVNGSYLTAGLVLSPHETSGNPLTTPDWLKVEYVGVPPGKNARLVVAFRAGGRERQLFTEGWPERNREGRPIGLQRLEIRFKGGEFEVWEQGQLAFASKDAKLPFDAAHLYLQMSSHSNYPAREVFFDNVSVQTHP